MCYETIMNKEISLRDAFVKREKRFKLLDEGILKTGWAGAEKLLEIGCAGGEAAEHLLGRGFSRLTCIDIDSAAVAAAAERVDGAEFVCADASSLPFPDGSFDGIFSEAAFAVITDKRAAAAEYFRVLKKGGRMLLNDFAIRRNTDAPRNGSIPMLAGVQTMDTYRGLLEEEGFVCVQEREEFAEFLRIAISLSKTFRVSPSEVGKYIVSAFGRDEYVTDFFSQTRMSYCQMIFEKRRT